MSICIAIAVPDGIALAADSQSTWNQTITKAKKRDSDEEFDLKEPIQIPVGWSRMTRKLFNLKLTNQNYAICVAGASTINNKTSYSIFKSLEKKFSIENPTVEQITSYFIDGIKAEFKLHFNRDDIENAEIRILEFIFCGFENEDVSKPVIQKHLVFSGTINWEGGQNSSGHIATWSNEGNYKFGGCWIGRFEFISHVTNHGNQNLPPITGQYHLMSLVDAADYTRFLVEFTCDYQRFALMVPDCARPIVCATLTPENYNEKIIE